MTRSPRCASRWRSADKDRPAADPIHRKLADFDGKLDGLRKQIVATTEGGAITGEERLREHTDQLYGAIIGWDGPPSTYALDNIVALRNQLNEVTAQFTHITSTELPAINKALQSKGGHALSVPPPTAFEDDDHEGGAGGVRAGGAEGSRCADGNRAAEESTSLELKTRLDCDARLCRRRRRCRRISCAELEQSRRTTGKKAPVVIQTKPWLFNRETRYAHTLPR